MLIAEILAGAEPASGAGQQQGAAAGVVLGLRQSVAQRPQHCFVAGVETLRPVERHDPVAVAPFGQDGGFIHGLPRSQKLAVALYRLPHTNCDATT